MGFGSLPSSASVIVSDAPDSHTMSDHSDHSWTAAFGPMATAVGQEVKNSGPTIESLMADNDQLKSEIRVLRASLKAAAAMLDDDASILDSTAQMLEQIDKGIDSMIMDYEGLLSVARDQLYDEEDRVLSLSLELVMEKYA